MTSATAAREMKTYCPISPSASVTRRQDQVRRRRPGRGRSRRSPPGVALRPPGSHASAAREEADEEHAEPEVGHRVEAPARPGRSSVSLGLPRRQAAMMPSRVPIHIESTVARPSSRSVFGIAVPSSSSHRLLGHGRVAEVAVREFVDVAPELRELALVVAALVDDRRAHVGLAAARGSGPSTGRRACGRGRS